MPWTKTDYPKAMSHLTSEQRAHAIEIANAILKDGGEEGVAIATAISKVKKAASKSANAGVPGSAQWQNHMRLAAHEGKPKLAAPGEEEAGLPDLDLMVSNEEFEQAVRAYRDTPEFKQPGDIPDAGVPQIVAALSEFLETEGAEPEDASFEAQNNDPEMVEVSFGKRTFLVCANYDVMETEATRRVTEDLENEPELFEQNFIQSHIDTDRLRSTLMSDVEEQIRESPESYGYTGGKQWTVTITGADGEVLEEAPEAFDDEDEAYAWGRDRADELKADNPDADYDVNERDTDGGEPDEDWIEAKAQEQLSDPVGYMQEIYGDDDGIKQAIALAGIDVPAAAAEAVSVDGPAHFMNTYDGNYQELPSGGVWMRIS